jgi:hypothetical protein
MAARIARVVRMRGRRQSAEGLAGTRSRLVGVLATGAFGLIPMLLWPPPAEAGGTACATTRLGTVCNRTDGTGLHVAGVRAWLDTRTWTCNKEFRVRGTLLGGRGYERSGVSQCGWTQVSLQFGVGQDFENGSYVCVGVREHGQGNPWEPSEACSRIRR